LLVAVEMADAMTMTFWMIYDPIASADLAQFFRRNDDRPMAFYSHDQIIRAASLVFVIAQQLEIHADVVIDTCRLGTKPLEEHFGTTRQGARGDDRDARWIHIVADAQLKVRFEAELHIPVSKHAGRFAVDGACIPPGNGVGYIELGVSITQARKMAVAHLTGDSAEFEALMRRLLHEVNARGGEHIPRQAADAGFAVLHRVLRKGREDGCVVDSVDCPDDSVASPEEIARAFDADPPQLLEEPHDEGHGSDSDDDDDDERGSDSDEEDHEVVAEYEGQLPTESDAEDFCPRVVHRITRGLKPSPAQVAVAAPLFAAVGRQVIEQAALPPADRAAWAVGIRTRAAGGPQRQERFTASTLLVVGAPCEVQWEADVSHDFDEGGWIVFPRMTPFIVRRGDGVAYHVIPWRDFVTRSEVGLLPNPSHDRALGDAADDDDDDPQQW
jgi:hypothetical protein